MERERTIISAFRAICLVFVVAATMVGAMVGGNTGDIEGAVFVGALALLAALFLAGSAIMLVRIEENTRKILDRLPPPAEDR